MTAGPQDRAARREALDEVCGLASAHPPLPAPRTSALLAAAAGGDADATERLVVHHLWVVRDAVMARPTSDLPVADLVQDGSAGLVLGLRRHLAAGGEVAGLEAALRQAVDRELDDAEARERAIRQEEARWVADSEIFAGAEIRLRRERGREPTTGELAVLLHWEEERVDRVREMATGAPTAQDVDLLAIISELDGGGVDGDGEG